MVYTITRKLDILKRCTSGFSVETDHFKTSTTEYLTPLPPPIAVDVENRHKDDIFLITAKPYESNKTQ